MDTDKIEMMFKLMEYDNLTDGQHDLVLSFGEQYDQRGYLSERQFEVLSDIFKRAAEK